MQGIVQVTVLPGIIPAMHACTKCCWNFCLAVVLTCCSCAETGTAEVLQEAGQHAGQCDADK
jgi:hypothetical protein